MMTNQDELLALLLFDQLFKKFSSETRSNLVSECIFDTLDELAYAYVGNDQLRCAENEYRQGNYEDAISYAKTAEELHSGHGRRKRPRRLRLPDSFA